MRSWDEISQDKRLVKDASIRIDPVNRERFSGSGWLIVKPKRVSEAAAVVFGSNENGWEHVSVSFRDRCPTWDEMCVAKDVFWKPDEACMELHPPEAEYVNIHKYCLHIWRRKKEPENILVEAIQDEINGLGFALQCDQGGTYYRELKRALETTMEWFRSPDYQERLSRCRGKIYALPKF